MYLLDWLMSLFPQPRRCYIFRSDPWPRYVITQRPIVVYMLLKENIIYNNSDNHNTPNITI